jgi:hypothetical protein
MLRLHNLSSNAISAAVKFSSLCDPLLNSGNKIVHKSKSAPGLDSILKVARLAECKFAFFS